LKFIPDVAPTLDYSHAPLQEQFDTQGIRQVELDVFDDPHGGLYANHPVRTLFGEPAASGIPELDEPGLKVLHVQDIDYETTCYTFVRCLLEIRDWSDAHPGHLPIMVLVEAKDEAIVDPLNLGFVTPLPFGAAALDSVDADTVQARSNDTTQRDAALSSGAQFISTDYPVPDLRFSDYQVTLPGGHIARCNLVNPGACNQDLVEE
jgi:hypothetical protein